MQLSEGKTCTGLLCCGLVCRDFSCQPLSDCACFISSLKASLSLAAVLNAAALLAVRLLGSFFDGTFGRKICARKEPSVLGIVMILQVHVIAKQFTCCSLLEMQRANEKLAFFWTALLSETPELEDGPLAES